MILICPICATRYEVDDSGIRDGCAVQCAACGHGWKVLSQPRDGVQLRNNAASDGVGRLGRADVEAMRQEAQDALMRSTPQYSYRHRQKTRRDAHLALARLVPWSLALALVVIGVVTAVLWRWDIVRMWPQAGRVYGFAGVEVSDRRFALQGLEVEHVSKEGQAVVLVRGRAVNETRTVRPPPVVDVVLMDQDGHRMGVYSARIEQQEVAPGASGSFELSIFDVPVGAHSVDVHFSDPEDGQAGDRGSVAEDSH